MPANDPPRPDMFDDTGELVPLGEATTDPSGLDERPPDSEAPHRGQVRGGVTGVLIQGALGAGVLFLLVVAPFGNSTVEEIIGFGLIVFGLFEIVGVVRRRGAPVTYLQPVAALAAGVVLWIWPEQTLEVAGYFLGGVVGIRGLLDVWAGARRWHEDGANAWVFMRGMILLGLSALVLLFPTHSVTIVVIGGALLAIARAIVTVWFSSTHRDALASVDASDTYAVVTYWLSRREMDAAAADEVESRVFIHVGNMKDRVWRFGVLMGLSTTIAVFGIAADSTAVVIGAMLIAPLMTPILGTAAGLINGKSRSTLISAGVAIAGAAGAITLAWLLSVAIPDLEAVIQNSQVTSRTSPSLGELIIALAAGAAGAYGVSRTESSDALPGVAVAIALVPPLSVVGITLHAGDFSQALGALLLFLTNFFSILLMAGLVFVLVGYGSWGRLYFRKNRIRVSFAVVTLAVVLVSIPLALTGQRILDHSSTLRNSTAAVTEWLGEDSALRIETIEVVRDTVTIELIGPDMPPAAEELSSALTDRMDRTMTAVVRWIREREFTSESTG